MTSTAEFHPPAWIPRRELARACGIGEAGLRLLGEELGILPSVRTHQCRGVSGWLCVTVEPYAAWELLKIFRRFGPRRAPRLLRAYVAQSGYTEIEYVEILRMVESNMEVVRCAA